LKDEAKNIEGKLEKERSQREHLKKVKVLIENKLDFSKKKAFKR